MDAELSALESLKAVKRAMDQVVVGHEYSKEALLLALAAQEHLYVEGEPGCAKTLLAEATSKAAGLSYHFCQMHRDSRVTDLVGDVVLTRTPVEAQAHTKEHDKEHSKAHSEAHSEAQGEVIAQSIRPGRLLTAQVAVLDDITRAPGEALNVLLRILNERRYTSEVLPLMTAVATSNPTDSMYYNEALDPANLDRFCLQWQVKGAMRSKDWHHAASIMQHQQEQDSVMTSNRALTAEERAGLQSVKSVLQQVEIPQPVLKAYQTLLYRLKTRYGCTPENSLLTDRSMLVKTPRLIKAMAFLRGRNTAKAEDLEVLRYVLTFRVPPEVYEQLDQMLEDLLTEEQQRQEEEQQNEQDQNQQAIGQGENQQDGEQEGLEQENAEGEDGQSKEMQESVQGEGDDAKTHRSVQQRSQGTEQSLPTSQQNTFQEVENIDMLMEHVRGRLEWNKSDMEVHPGGAPRAYRTMRRFDEILDADAAEVATWIEQIKPVLPRSYERKKRNKGGRVVIIRDVSQSMEGRYARWTSSVVARLVDVVRKQRMRIGYIEFNHQSHKFNQQGQFFTRNYERIIERASNVSCSGVTNYQHPLQDALKELRKGQSVNRHILFLTDGEPTQGDWLVREERKAARDMGVCIHTLFIGTTECPEILDLLSEETAGSQFLAVPDDKGKLSINPRKTEQ